MSFSTSLREQSEKNWEACYRHPFVQELGAGTLDRTSFQFYLLQDYVYLLDYARVFAAGALKSTTERVMARFSEMQHAILCTEMDLHRRYMQQFGIEKEEAEATRPSLFNKAYTANMLATAHTGGVAEILAVVLPCAWSYYDYAVRLKEDYADALEGNFYRSWIESYAGDEYRNGIDWLFEELDAAAAGKSETERQRLAELFDASVEFEYLFWDMSYRRQMSF